MFGGAPPRMASHAMPQPAPPQGAGLGASPIHAMLSGLAAHRGPPPMAPHPPMMQAPGAPMPLGMAGKPAAPAGHMPMGMKPPGM